MATRSVEDSGSGRVGVNASTSFGGLEVGSHVVQLGGVAGNCGIYSGSARRTIDVAAGDTVAAVFAISCTPNVSVHADDRHHRERCRRGWLCGQGGQRGRPTNRRERLP